MEPVEAFKHFALIAIFIMVTAGSFMVWKGPRDKTKSVSQHAATANKKLYVLYALAALTGIVLFYIFCLFWFIPTFHLPSSFSLLLYIFIFLLVLTALIPEKGKGIKAHIVVSYGFAFIMILLLFLIAASQQISLFARIVSGVGALFMASFWYLVFLSPYKKQVFSQSLLYQYAYVVSFCLSILAATYIR